MKQAIAWTILVVLVLLCLGLSTINYLLAVKVAQELGAVQAQTKKSERAVVELHELVAQLKNQQVQSSETFHGELLANETAWTNSADGRVQVKLTAERDVSSPGRPMTLLFTAKNNHGQPLTIDSPLLAPWDIDVSLDGQRVHYRGGIPDPQAPQPVPLQPGAVARFHLLLTPEQFPELAKPGVFQVEFTYRSGFQNTWKGNIGPLTARWVNQ